MNHHLTHRRQGTAKCFGAAVAMLMTILVQFATNSAFAAGPYYWDSNTNTAGFGTATGTWSATTAPTATQGWSTDATGASALSSVTTATTDTSENFGAAATGLGAGTVTVSGTVNSGPLFFGAASGAITLSGGTLTLPAAATITVNNTADIISSILAGAATSLTLNGVGTLTLSGANTYAGTTAINAGTLKLGNALALGTTAGNTTIASGATLDLNGQTIAEPFGTITGTGVGGLGALINSSGTTATNTGTITGGNFTVGGSGNMNFAQVTGGATLAKIGAGTLTLSGTADNVSTILNINGGIAVLAKTSSTTVHAFGGASSVGSGGTIQLGGSGGYQMYGGTSLTVSSGGVLDLNGQTQNYNALAGSLNLNGTGISNGGALINSSGTAAMLIFGTGGLVLQSDSAIGGAGSLSVTGVVSGAFALTKVGAGTATLYSVNTYSGTGGTTVSGGKLTIGGAGSLGSGTYAQPISLASGATLEYSSTAAQTFSGPITGAGGLMADSAGAYTLTLSGTANTYSGPTTIANGIRISAGPANLSPNTTLTITGTASVGGQLFLTAGGTVANNMTISGVGFLDSGVSYGAVRTASGTILSGTITLAGNARIAGHAGVGGTITGQLTGTGGYGLDFLDGNAANNTIGTYLLQNTGTSNSYNGYTSISCVDYAGASYTGCKTILKLGASDQIPNGAGAGLLTFNGTNAGHISVFELNGFNETVNGLSNVNAAGAIIQNTTAGASTLTVGDANTSSAFSGVITDGGSGASLALTKIGSGALTLSGASSYTGGTTVNAGRLYINGALNGGTVNVAGGATLGGSGVIAGAVTINNNAVIETGGGNGVGTLTVGTLALGATGTDASSIVISNVASTAELVVANLSAASGPGSVVIKLFGVLPTSQVPLIKYSGSIGGTGFPAFTVLTMTPNYAVTLVNNTANQSIDLVPNTVNLVWNGNGSSSWCTNTLAVKNWGQGSATGPGADFYNYDTVIFNDTLTGTSTVNISSNNLAPGFVFFNNSAANYTVGGTFALINSPALTKTGTGTVTVQNSAANTLGAVTVTGGAMKLANVGADTVGAVTVSNATMTLANTGANTLGAVTVNSAGTLLVDSTNTPASVTIGTGGTIQVGNADANGSLSGPMTDNGSVIFNRTDAGLTMSGVISGTGSVIQQGTGSTTISAVQSYSGPTLVNAGKLVLASTTGGSGCVPNSAISVASGAELDVNANDASGYAVNNGWNIAGTVRKLNSQSETLYRPIVMNNGTLSSANAVEQWNFFGNYIQTAPGTTNYILGSGMFGLRTATAYFSIATNSALVFSNVVEQNANATLTPLNKFGPGTLYLTATNTYTGNTVIGGGTLSLGTSGVITNTPLIALGAGAVFDVSSLPTPFVLGQVKAQNLAGAGTVKGSILATNALATLTPGSNNIAGTLSFNNSLTLSNANLVYDLANGNTTVGGGVNDLIQMNGGAVALGGTNLVALNLLGGLTNPVVSGTYTLLQGAGSINGGAANLALGTIGGLTARASSVSFATTANTVTMTMNPPNSLVWAGTNGFNWDLVTTNWNNGGKADEFFNYDAVTFNDSAANNTVNLNTAVAPASMTVNSASNYVFTSWGANSLTGAFPLAKQGSGTMIVSNANASYTGPVSVTGGTLQLGYGGLGQGTLGAAPITVTAPGAVSIVYSNSGAVTYANPITGNGTVNLIGFNSPATLLYSDYALTGNTAGTPFTGTWNVNGARMAVTGSSPAGSTINVANSGQVYLGAFVYPQAFNIAGLGWNETAGILGAIRFGSASTVVTGPINLTANARLGIYANNGLVAGPITGPYELELWGGSTASTLTLACPSNTVAAMRVNGAIYVSPETPTAYSAGPLILTNSGNLRLNGFNFTFANVSGPNGTIRNDNGTAGDNSMFTVGTDNTSTTFGGTFVNGSTATLGLTKVGTGTLTLTGVGSSYTGNTYVNAGTLALSNSATLTGTPYILVASNATYDVSGIPAGYVMNAGQILGGSGLIRGNVFAPTATLSPGSLFTLNQVFTPGTLSFANNLVLSNASTCYFNLTTNTAIGGGTNSLITVAGNLTAGFATVSIISGTNDFAVGTYTLFTYSNTLAGAFNPTVVFDKAATGYLDYSVSNQVRLVVTSYSGASSLTWSGTSTSATWDLNLTPNFNSGTARFTDGSSVVFNDSVAYATVGLSGTLMPSAISVNTTNPLYLFSGSGSLAGPGGLTKSGSGTLTIANTGVNTFAGNILVNGGKLVPGTATAFGNGGGFVTVANGGTLDVNAQKLSTETFYLAGAGYDGNGAVVNNNSANIQSHLKNVVLSGNTTVGGSQTLEFGRYYGATFVGNGFSLTKTNANTFWLNQLVVDATLGSINVNQGTFGVDDTHNSLGNPASTLTVANGATLQFYSDDTIPDYYAKNFVFQTNATVYLNGGNAFEVLNGNITLNGLVNFNVAAQFLQVNAPMTGSGGLVKFGSNPLFLAGTNIYSGATYVTGGTLALTNNGSLPNSALLYVASGCTFNTVAVPNYALPSGQTLAGAGTVTGVYTAGSGTIIQPGGVATIGTLAMGNSLTLNNSTVELELSPGSASGNDLLTVAGNLTLAGTTTLKLHAMGVLNTNQYYTVITYSGQFTGTAANFTVVSDSRYSFTVDTGVAGQIRVLASGVSANLTWKGTGANPTYWDNTTVNWVNGVTPDTFHSGDNVTLDDTASTYTLNVQAATTLGAMTVNTTNIYLLQGNPANPASLLGTALNLNGPGRLTLGRTNNFPTFNFNAGSLQLGNGGADGWLTPFPAVIPTGNTLAFNRADAITLSTVISGGGSLLQLGTNTLTLSGASTYTGGTTISAGTLNLATATTPAGIGAITLGDANTGTNSVQLMLAVNAVNPVTVSALGSGPVTINYALTASLVTPIAYTLNRPTTISGTSVANYCSLGGLVQGNVGTLTIIGPASGQGVAFQNNNNTFIGTIVLASGNMESYPTAFVTNPVVMQSAASTYAMGDAVTGTTMIDSLSGVGTVTTVNQGGATHNPQTLSLGNRNGSGSFSGTIANGNVVVSLDKEGTGTETLSGTLSYTGNTTVNNGVLRLVNPSGFNSTVSVNNSGVYCGTLEISNTIPLTWAPEINGNGVLVKTGAATLTITNTNPSFVSGTNIIAGGTESIVGDLGQPGLVLVNSGATLNGAGGSVSCGTYPLTVNTGGTIAAANGAVFPVNGVGLALGASASDNTYSVFTGNGMRVSGSIAVSGALTLNGTHNVSFVGPVPTAAGTYPLITYNSSSGACVFNVNLPAGYSGYVTNDTSVSAINLVIQSVGTDTLVWVGSPNNWDLSHNLVWTSLATSASAGFVNGDSVLFDDTTANNAVAIAAGVTPGVMTVNTANGYSFQGAALSFAGSLVNNGSGTVMLNNNATLGGLVMNNGLLVAAGNETFTNLILNGGTLQLGNGGSSGWVNLPSTFNVISNNTAVAFSRADNLSVGTVFTGDGSLIQNGPGVITLATNNSFNGDIVINGGTLRSGVARAGTNCCFGPVFNGNTRTVTINSGGLWDLNIANLFGNHANISGPTLIVNSNGVARNSFLATAASGNNALWNVTLNNGTLTSTYGSTSTVGNGPNGASPNRTYGAWNLNGSVYSSGNSFITSTAPINGQSMLSGQSPGITGFVVTNGTLTVTVPLIDSDWGGGSASGLTLTGNGTLVLSGVASLAYCGATNGFTGATTVGDNGGSGTPLLRLVDNTSYSSAITLQNGGLELTNSGNWIFGPTISGSGSLAKSGSGTVTLANGGNSYNGPTAVNGGTLLVNGLSSSSLVSVNHGAFGGQGIVGSAVSLNDNCGLMASTNSPLTLNGGLTLGSTANGINRLTCFADPVSGVPGYLSVQNSFTCNGTNIVNLSGQLPANYPATYTLVYYPGGSFSGSGVFVAGNLANVQGYIVNDTVNGYVQLMVTNATPPVANSLVWVGTPANNWWDLSGANVWKYIGSGLPTGYADGATVQLDDTATDFSVFIAANVSPAAITVSNNVNNYTIGGSAGIMGSGSLTKSGAATLTLVDAANSFAGGTMINNGTVQIGNGAINGSFGPGAYTLAGGTRLYLNYATAVPSGTGLWSSQIGGSGTLELNSAQAVNATAQWGANSAAATPFSSSFTGTLQLDNGRIDAAPAGLGGISNIIINNNAQFMAWSGTYNVPITISGTNGWGESGQPEALRLAGNQTATWAGNVTLAANSGLYAQGGSTFTIAGSIAGPYACEFSSAATLNVTPAAPVQNAYGTTIISGAGSVVAGNQYAFSTNALWMNGGILKLNGFNFTFANLAGTAGTVGNYNGTAGVNSVITVNADNSSTLYSGTLANGSTGLLGLNKVGTGTLTLSGANITYTGGTLNNAGTLALQDTTAFGAWVTNAGGTLNLNRTSVGFANRNKVSNLISGGGASVVNVNCSSPTIAGGWVTFNGVAAGLTNFNGTLNINSGVLAMDNQAGIWSNSVPTLNVYAGGLFAIRAQNNCVADALNGNGDVLASWNGHGATGDTFTIGAANGSGTFTGVIHGNIASGGTDGTMEQGVLNLIKAGSGTEMLSGVNTYGGWTTISNGTLAITGSGQLGSGNYLALITNYGTFAYASTAPQTLGGVISGTGSLIKTNGSVLTLTAANSYSGATAVNGGKLVVSSAQAGAGAISILDGATLGATASGASSLKPATLTLGASVGATMEFSLNSSGVAPLAPAAPITINGTPTVNIVTCPGLAGMYPLVSNYSGVTPNYGTHPAYITAGLTVAANVLYLNVTNVTFDLWSGLINGNWDLATTNWSNNLVPTLYASGYPVQFDDTASGNTSVTIIPASVTPAAVFVTNNTLSYSIGGNPIAGAATLSKTGTNNLTLTVANSYNGSTIISAGTLTLTNSSVLYNGVTNTGTLFVGSGAQLNDSSSTINAVCNGYNNQTWIVNGTINVNGSNTTTLAPLILMTNGTLTGLSAPNWGTYFNSQSTTINASGNSRINAASVGGSTTLTINTPLATDALVISSVLGSTNAANNTGGLVKTNLGTLTLSGTNTYTGGTTVGTSFGGTNTLLITSSQALGTGAVTIGGNGNNDGSRLALMGGITLTNTLNSWASRSAPFAPNLVNVSGTNTVTSALTAGAGGGASILESDAGLLIVTGANTVRQLNLQGAGNGSCQGALNLQSGYGVLMNGPGTWTLSGANTYTGDTTISGGTLLINNLTGSGTGSGNVNVNSGTLGGTGTIAGGVTNNAGGILSPGVNGVGALTISGSLTLNAGSTSTFAVNGSTPANTSVVLGSAVAYGGVLNLVPTGVFTNGQTFTLFSGAGATQLSNFASLVGSPGGGNVFSFTNGVLTVVSTGPSGPAHLNSSVSGHTLSLSWPAGQGWRLVCQTNALNVGLSTNWMPAAVSSVSSTNITMDPTQPTVFYRLVYP